MPSFTLKHEINCDEATFWKVFVDNEFNTTLYRNVLEFPEFEITEQRESDTEITRKAKGKPKMNMPGPVAKLLGSSFGYVEEGRFDKATKVWKFKVIPSTLADKMRNEGSVRLEPAGEGKVRRVVELIIEAKIFGVGGMLESTAEKSMKDGWEKSAVYMNDWLAKKKA
jgi:hypothetical protein